MNMKSLDGKNEIKKNKAWYKIPNNYCSISINHQFSYKMNQFTSETQNYNSIFTNWPAVKTLKKQRNAHFSFVRSGKLPRKSTDLQLWLNEAKTT